MSTPGTEIQGSILKEGWLLKRSKHLKQWRNRWVQISDQCILYSFKNRFDKKASQIVDLRHFPSVRIISTSNNHKLNIKKTGPFSLSSVKQKQKENKLNTKKVLENKIIELSSCNSNNKTIYQFKTLMYLPWFNIFTKCQNIIDNIANTDCLLTQIIPAQLMSTIIASYLYSFERFILCRISKWFYSLFNINEYNFIYHYFTDCLYWIQNIQQYISTASYFSPSSIHSMHKYRHRTSSSTERAKYVTLDLTNGNLSHLLNDVIKMQQLKFFVLAYDQIIQLQNISFLERKLSLKQKLLLKESYSLVFEQRKQLPSYIYKKQQQQFTVNKLNRSHSLVTATTYNGYFSDDISYLMIPANINTINLNGNKSDFHKYGAMKFLYSIILCGNLSGFTINPLQNIKLDDNMLDINDISLFVESLLNRRTEMDNLQKLSLNANPRIYSIESMKLLFESIGRKCPNLQVLSLRRINGINDEIFKIIVNFYKKYMNQTKLTTISLVGCCNVSLEGIDWLDKNLFDLQNKGNYSLFANIDILINIPKTQIIKHNHQSRWDKRIVVC